MAAHINTCTCSIHLVRQLRYTTRACSCNPAVSSSQQGGEHKVGSYLLSHSALTIGVLELVTQINRLQPTTTSSAPEQILTRQPVTTLTTGMSSTGMPSSAQQRHAVPSSGGMPSTAAAACSGMQCPVACPAVHSSSGGSGGVPSTFELHFLLEFGEPLQGEHLDTPALGLTREHPKLPPSLHTPHQLLCL